MVNLFLDQKKKMIRIIKFTFLILFFCTNLFAFEAQETQIEEIEEKKPENLTIADLNPEDFAQKAVLQGLNKITAKTKLLEIEVGEEIQFGKLDITVHKCWKAPLHEKLENKMLIEVFDRANVKKDTKKERKRLFFGWILSSSPSISGIEHPIYDLTAIKCIKEEIIDEQQN